MKKIIENPKLMIALVIIIALCVVGLAFGINQIIKKDKESRMNAITNQLIEFGVPEDDALNMSEEEATETIDQLIKEANLNGYIFDAKKKEYPDTVEATNRINEYIANESWSNIVSYVNNIKGQYNFTTLGNMNLITAALDAEKIDNLETWTGAQYSNYLNTAMNPSIYLKVFGKMREGNLLDYYLDTNGLFPYYNNNYSLKTTIYEPETEEGYKKIEEEKYFYNIKDFANDGWTSITKAEVKGKIDANPTSSITCYIGNQYNTLIRIIGCYGYDGDLFNVAEFNNVINGID